MFPAFFEDVRRNVEHIDVFFPNDFIKHIWNQSCFAVLFAALLGLYLFRERENSLLTSRDRSVTQMLLLIHLKFNQTMDSRQIKTFNTQIKQNKIAHFYKEQGFEFI